MGIIENELACKHDLHLKPPDYELLIILEVSSILGRSNDCDSVTKSIIVSKILGYLTPQHVGEANIFDFC